jgi:putative heme-binding domain-containing protein
VNGPSGMSDDVGAIGNELTDSRTQFAADTEGRMVILAKGAEKGSWFQARTEISVLDETGVEFLASSSGSLQIWLNGKSIYRREEPRSFRIDSDRLFATLAKGNNRLVMSMEVGSSESPVEFHLRFRRRSAVAEHERLAEAALARPGNPERGRGVFFNVEKSLCLKCHRMSDQGERIGPDLTGLGSRFSRIYIAESILEPSRTIAPSFGTWLVLLQSGQVLSGIKVAESETMLTLADNQGQKQSLAKAAIEEQKTSLVSTMPEGLEKRITEEEFVDLIAFLASLKEGRTP